MEREINIPAVREIIKDYLRQNGFDGLFNSNTGGGCGCGLDDFAPCEGAFGAGLQTDCKPAWHREKCDGCPAANDCESESKEFNDGCFSQNWKPE